MTEGTARPESFDRETIERSTAAGERTFSSDVWSDKSTAEKLTTMARSERTSTGLSITTGDTWFIAPILTESPVIRLVPKVSDTPPRVTAVGDKPTAFEGPLGDKYLRYSTADTTGRGVNQTDIDHLGVVKGFAFQDDKGLRRVIAGERLTRLMVGTEVDGWKSARTGSGAEAMTVVTAPDGRTTYKVDGHGRLISDVGSNTIAPLRGILATPLPGGTRLESTGAAGEVRSAFVDKKGDFVSLTLRSPTGDRQLRSEDLTALKPGGSANLGGNWTATRGDFGGRLSGDTIRLGHPDGTSYYVNPEGRLLHTQGPNETFRVSMGPLGDMGTRYTTADRRHMGENSIDVDDLGLVRGLAFKTNEGSRYSLPMALLDKVPADGQAHRMPGDWQVSRTGSGAEAVTSIVAPDGRTTYRLDSLGRLTSGVSAVERAARSEIVARDLGDKATRHDSVMADGSLSSAVVGTDGALSRITLRGRTTTTSTSIARTEWEAASTGSAGGSLGNGWSVEHVDNKFTGNQVLPHGSLVITHNDGTAYYVGPDGKFISARTSWAASRRR